MKIGVGFLSVAEIEAVVDGLRKEYDLYEIPIDVEKGGVENSVCLVGWFLFSVTN